MDAANQLSYKKISIFPLLSQAYADDLTTIQMCLSLITVRKKGNESCVFCPAAQVSHKYSGYVVFVPKINAKLPHDLSNLVMSWGLVFASLVPTRNVTNHMTNQNQLAITSVRTRSHVVTFLVGIGLAKTSLRLRLDFPACLSGPGAAGRPSWRRWDRPRRGPWRPRRARCYGRLSSLRFPWSGIDRHIRRSRPYNAWCWWGCRC